MGIFFSLSKIVEIETRDTIGVREDTPFIFCFLCFQKRPFPCVGNPKPKLKLLDEYFGKKRAFFTRKCVRICSSTVKHTKAAFPLLVVW